jgi:uncharacterized membrane protein
LVPASIRLVFAVLPVENLHLRTGASSNIFALMPLKHLYLPLSTCVLIPLSRFLTEMEILAVLVAVLVIGGPIAAIIAFSRIRSLEEKLPALNFQELISRLYNLEQKLAALEKKWSSGAVIPQPLPVPEVRPASPPPPVVPPAAPSLQRPTVPIPSPPPVRPRVSQPSAATPPLIAGPPFHVSHESKSSALDLESRIAGRWFNRIGIVAILFAVSYFLKLAFDNNWIGPSGRVAIGILFGALMLPWSQWLLGRGYSYFSEGIAGLGEATLYVSVWAGCQYYSLYSRDVGFWAMILITALMAAVALGRNSQRIALLSLIGGFLTPLLVSSGKDEQVVLFTYLLILGAGFLVIGARRSWVSLAPLSFLFSLIYYWGWYGEFYHRTHPLERTVVFATLFFLVYAALPVIRALSSALGAADILVQLLNAFAYLAALYALLWPEDRWPLTLFVLALAAAHLVVARLMPQPAKGESPLARFLFAGLALTFATLAIPIRLDGNWITLAFAVEGAILVWSGFRTATNFLRQTGYLLLAIAALRVIFLPPPAGQLFWNERFATYLVMIACFGVSLWAARDQAPSVADNERAEIGILAVLINVYALIALSLELWDFYGRAASGLQADFARHLALSALWTLYASGLIFFGVQRRSALLRWQALILFGVTVVKVFLYDLSFLERAYRILSFLILGTVLLIVSFLYQRKLARERSG